MFNVYVLIKRLFLLLFCSQKNVSKLLTEIAFDKSALGKSLAKPFVLFNDNSADSAG